jgi:hypothetical protein
MVGADADMAWQAVNALWCLMAKEDKLEKMGKLARGFPSQTHHCPATPSTTDQMNLNQWANVFECSPQLDPPLFKLKTHAECIHLSQLIVNSWPDQLMLAMQLASQLIVNSQSTHSQSACNQLKLVLYVQFVCLCSTCSQLAVNLQLNGAGQPAANS